MESIAKSQGIKSEDSDVSKTQKKEYRPLKNPTSISDDIASLLAKGEGVAMENLSNDDSEENSIENKTENPEPSVSYKKYLKNCSYFLRNNTTEFLKFLSTFLGLYGTHIH